MVRGQPDRQREHTHTYLMSAMLPDVGLVDLLLLWHLANRAVHYIFSLGSSFCWGHDSFVTHAVCKQKMLLP